MFPIVALLVQSLVLPPRVSRQILLKEHFAHVLSNRASPTTSHRALRTFFVISRLAYKISPRIAAIFIQLAPRDFLSPCKSISPVNSRFAYNVSLRLSYLFRFLALRTWSSHSHCALSPSTSASRIISHRVLHSCFVNSRRASSTPRRALSPSSINSRLAYNV